MVKHTFNRLRIVFYQYIHQLSHSISRIYDVLYNDNLFSRQILQIITPDDLNFFASPII